MSTGLGLKATRRGKVQVVPHAHMVSYIESSACRASDGGNMTTSIMIGKLAQHVPMMEDFDSMLRL